MLDWKRALGRRNWRLIVVGVLLSVGFWGTAFAVYVNHVTRTMYWPISDYFSDSPWPRHDDPKLSSKVHRQLERRHHLGKDEDAIWDVNMRRHYRNGNWHEMGIVSWGCDEDKSSDADGSYSFNSSPKCKVNYINYSMDYDSNGHVIGDWDVDSQQIEENSR